MFAWLRSLLAASLSCSRHSPSCRPPSSRLPMSCFSRTPISRPMVPHCSSSSVAARCPRSSAPGRCPSFASSGSETYRVREQAMSELTRPRSGRHGDAARGRSRTATSKSARRAEKCLARIQEKDVAVDVPAAAARLSACASRTEPSRRCSPICPLPTTTASPTRCATVLGSLASIDGKANPVLVAGLTDKLPVRRAAAGEALAARRRAQGRRPQAAQGRRAHRPPARRRWPWPTPGDAGRYAGAHRRVCRSCRSRRPGYAEDVLYRARRGQESARLSPLGNDEAEPQEVPRRLARLVEDRTARTSTWPSSSNTATLLGYTLVVLLDEGRVMELGTDNQPRWQVDNLVFPLDAQFLPGDRVLVRRVPRRARHRAQPQGRGPLAKAHRRPARRPAAAERQHLHRHRSAMLEVDRDGKEIFIVRPARPANAS